MQVDFSYSIPVRKRNGLQNCIYNMISILFKLDTTSPIHTENEVWKDITQHVNNGLFWEVRLQAILSTKFSIMNTTCHANTEENTMQHSFTFSSGHS